MDRKIKETITVGCTALLFIAVFGSLIILDRSHGSFGAEIDPDLVNAVITNSQGRMNVDQVPTGLFMFGAGLSASVSVKITNMDPDNDIDSVRFTIPGSQVQSSSFEWYLPGLDHEWDMTSDQPGIAVFTARDDLPGRIFGGSAQYDVAGNIDDALDHDPLNNTNEAATFTVSFTAPTQPGFKTGTNALNVEVADLKTESPGSTWKEVDPFPMPYLVVENQNRFVVMILKTTTCDLSVVHDGNPYFVPTRASDITYSPVGFKLKNSQDQTVIIVSDPGPGKTVKPMVHAKSAGLQGDFTLSMFSFEVINKVTSEVSVQNIATDYKEPVPQDTSATADTDLDNDGVLNNLDIDMDGDGIPNNIDPDPRDPMVNNVAPSNVVATVDKNVITEGEKFVLTGDADDANNDDLTFTWTHDKDPAWKLSSQSGTVSGLKPGTYTFTLTVSDGELSTTDTVTITVEKKDRTSPVLMIIVIVMIVLIIVAIIVYFIITKRKKPEKLELEDGLEQTDPEPASETSPPMVDEIDTDPAPQGQKPTAPVLTDQENVLDQEPKEPCSECGTPLSSTDTKCPVCGAEFDLEVQCPKCQQMITNPGANCPNCGIQFNTG